MKVAIVFVLATIAFYFAIETAWFTYAEYAKESSIIYRIVSGCLGLIA